MSKRLAIVGMGKMGHAIAELAPKHDFQVVAQLDIAETQQGITKESLNNADVAVEFTTPDAAPRNIRAIVKAGIPVIVGTTGWYGQLPELKAEIEKAGGAMLSAANFSLGVNIFEQIIAHAAKLLKAAPGFEAVAVETHHSAKKDAPSGTAITLEKAARAEYGREIPITSIRVGAAPGTHEFIFDAPFETIHLEHVARDRRVFAEGALVAARWLIGRRGVFTMRDVLSSS